MTKTSIKKAAWVYLAAFLLMALSFHADAKTEDSAKKETTQTESVKTETEKKESTTKDSDKKESASKDSDKKESKDTKAKDSGKKDKATKKSEGKKMSTVVMETSLGKIEIELDGAKAPKTTENFLKYVSDKFYDGTIFHRVIPGFMVQGGGMKEDMSEKSTRKSIENEATNGLKNKKGTIAMARTSDPHSASAQFFINLQDNDFLDHTGQNPRGWGYAVFGKVTSGMDVVEKMAGVATGNHGMHENVPKTPIVIKTVTVK